MKLITIKQLKMTNFMGYKGEVVLDFQGRDIIGILAEYEDDPVRSNRAGKTTILEAFSYNLAGISRAKDEKSLIHKGEKFFITEGTYTDGSQDYVIKRGRDHKGKGILEVNWTQKVVEGEEEIEKVFGIHPKDFPLTSFFKQSDIHGFMGMKPTDKANFLMRWLDNEHWKEKEELAKEDLKVLKQKLRDNENLKKALESSLEIDESLVSTKAEFEKENVILKEESSSLSEQIGVVSAEIKDITQKKLDLNNKIIEKEEEVEKLNEQIEEAGRLSTDLENHRSRYKKLKHELNTELGTLPSVSECNSTISTLKARMSEIKSSLNSAKSDKGICPIIKKQCDSISYSEADIKALNTRLKDCENGIVQWEANLDKNERRTDIIHQLEILTTKANNLKSKIVDVDKTKETITALEAEIVRMKEQNKSLTRNALLEKQTDLQEQKNVIDKKIKKNDAEILDIEVRVSEAKKAKTKIDAVVEENVSLQEKIATQNSVVFMFSKSGIPSLEIENSFQEIEDNINYILTKMNTGFTCSFSPDKETTKKEPVCHCGFQFPVGFRGGACPDCGSKRQLQRKDEISFKIIEDGEESDFEMDSGGGRQIVSYAVRIALTMLKRSNHKCNLNVIFLDEVDSALDPYLATQIINSVTKFLTKELGYEQVIMVSHKAQVKEALPHIIKVTKKGKYSVARFV